MIHPQPYANGVIEFTWSSGVRSVYTVDEIIVVLMFLRVYTLNPLMHRSVGLHSAKAKLAAKLNQVNINLGFTAKAMLKDFPLTTIVSLCAVLTFYLAHCLMIAERGVCGSNEDYDSFDEQQDPSFYTACPYAWYANSVWNILVTMTTVGR